ncbi:hypothetical protein [Actinophytocola sp.]|nr:hypothetical protein [Actinophytocola sp.]HYQ62542.1 hypothetical protein [Actinophytocola sp.]
MAGKSDETANAGCGHPSASGKTDGYCSSSGCWNHYENRHKGSNGP